MTRSLSWLGFLFLAVILCQSNIAVAQSTDADRFKHAAPEKCVAYMMWNADQAQPIEGNKTQTLMAEPDVKTFVDDIKLRAGLLAPALAERSGMPKLKRERLHWLSPKFVEAIVDHSGCMFVEELDVPRGGKQPPIIKAAILLQPPGDVDRFVKRFGEVMKSKGEKSQQVALAETDAYQVAVDGSSLDMFFGNANGTCVIALGEDAYVGAINRMKAGKTPAWLVELEQRAAKLKHVYSIGYVDNKSIMRAAGKAFGASSLLVAEVLGLENVDSIEMINGLNEVDSSIHLLIKTGETEGLLGLLTRQGANEMRAEFPADSLIAGTATVDFVELLDWLDTAQVLMGGRGMGWGQVVAVISQQMEIDIEEDLLGNLGKSWAFYNGASDGWLTGLTLVGEVKNAEELSDTLETFFRALDEQAKKIPNRYRPRIYKQQYQGQTIYSFQQPDLWAEPSFCVADNRFYVAGFPQAIMTAIGGSTRDGTLFDETQLAKFQQSVFLGDSAKLTALAYLDTKTQAQLAYPTMQAIKSGMEDRYGFFETSNLRALVAGMQLPPARTVIRHLEPTISCVRASDEGVEIEIRQTIPTNTVAIAMPVAVTALMPSVGGVRTAASATQSSNNLRQLGLACLNYESAFMEFPRDVAAKNEDADHRFSWRVHILPFIEENNLYSQIHFDEPWDSEHNKTLHAQMPKCFRSPSSNAEPGMTVYRGFKGNGILGGDDEGAIGFANIIDGSSNTILAMEVDDKLATPWMKPGGMDIDKVVVEEIFGNHKFANAVYGDCHTNRIPSTVDEEDFRNLMRRDDGNVVDPDFQRNRRNNRNELPEADPRFVEPGPKDPF